MKQINRLKAVLTNKWVVESVEQNGAIASRWCTNFCQPPMEIMNNISKLLHVDVQDLLFSSKTDSYGK
ncbi:MAG: XRE family transcriptional regulator [Tannerella sp.]|jgi:hypothetical protein|nr:XRE family transcriptional regulator [Tannerella sp.]